MEPAIAARDGLVMIAHRRSARTRAPVMETVSTTLASATACGRRQTVPLLAARITAPVTAIAATERACAVGVTQGLIAQFHRARMSAPAMERARMGGANVLSRGLTSIAQ